MTLNEIDAMLETYVDFCSAAETIAILQPYDNTELHKLFHKYANEGMHEYGDGFFDEFASADELIIDFGLYVKNLASDK